MQLTTTSEARLDEKSEMGQRDLGRLVIAGATLAEVQQAIQRGMPEGSWLSRLLARKLRKLVVVALASRIALIFWASMTKKETHRISDTVAA